MNLSAVTDFSEPINLAELSNDEGYFDTQLGKHVAAFETDFPDIQHADLVIVGCGEMRGNGILQGFSDGPNLIRSQFYKLFHWHHNISIADIGNIKPGATMQDTYAALQMVVSELLEAGKRVVILGGSHDLTLAQYNAYSNLEKIIEASCIDAAIDLDMDSPLPANKFLMEMLTGEPNFIKHYNHIGFQSYLVHPQMLQTIDKLRFNCYRVGMVKENLEEIEPDIRNSHLVSFDISAIQHAHAPSNLLTPNGFTGEEACTLMQYTGMSAANSSIGIYGYNPDNDVHQLTAKQISHMLWYLMDGMYKGKLEADLEDSHQFNEYHLMCANVDTKFLQSKKSKRWWMQAHDGKMIPCSKTDYLIASNNEIPERWLRAVERS